MLQTNKCALYLSKCYNTKGCYWDLTSYTKLITQSNTFVGIVQQEAASHKWTPHRNVTPRLGVSRVWKTKSLPCVEHPWRNNCRERTWAGRSPWSCDSQSQCLPTAQTQTRKKYRMRARKREQWHLSQWTYHSEFHSESGLRRFNLEWQLR